MTSQLCWLNNFIPRVHYLYFPKNSNNQECLPYLISDGQQCYLIFIEFGEVVTFEFKRHLIYQHRVHPKLMYNSNLTHVDTLVFHFKMCICTFLIWIHRLSLCLNHKSEGINTDTKHVSMSSISITGAEMLSILWTLYTYDYVMYNLESNVFSAQWPTLR